MALEIYEQTGQGKGALAPAGEQLAISRETLRDWVNQAKVDGGQGPGTSVDDGQRIAELEREVRELRRAKGILESAPAGARPPKQS